ncbi:MAG: hypothetical protein AB7O52_20110 [Planctomycetota bacterium]
MPILDIEMVLNPGDSLPHRLASDLAHRAGEILGTTHGRTWVRLRALPSSSYAENDEPVTKHRPIFVNVLKSRRPEGLALVEEVARLTQALAEVCGRPADYVHLFYEPDGAGRVAFGGKLLE